MYKKLYVLDFIFIFMGYSLNMEITTYTAFRQHLKSFLDKVLSSHSPLFVTRANGEDVVVISKADYESMMETFYLLKSPANASRLSEALQEYEKGKGEERGLIEE
ncbi:type II toxin-antitoxin system Phd/YefM family antitoxin [Pedobacter sp. L105]|uniref:type II toxin-antitoxin system Phd/YefM family antitoxin n=1 Tax=Pedobacter sp. L105 TaxID=1641871 RepID=UPI0020B1285D|nr:type II toxin-antitoxin system prevent-host-death family antitoxin [Pedobacter sp. L105]